jgi:hypothetical protein
LNTSIYITVLVNTGNQPFGALEALPDSRT